MTDITGPTAARRKSAPRGAAPLSDRTAARVRRALMKRAEAGDPAAAEVLLRLHRESQGRARLATLHRAADARMAAAGETASDVEVQDMLACFPASDAADGKAPT